MASNKIIFKNQDGADLSARLALPIDQEPTAFAVFAHCFTCNKNLTAIRNISHALTRHGFGVLRFDFTGLGESEGDIADTDFSSNIQDLVAAAKYLEQEYEAPKLLIGHSLGGAAVIYAAKELDSVQAVATIGAPSSPAHLQHILKSSLEEIESSGVAIVEIGGRPFKIKKQFLDDISQHQMPETVKTLRKALLIMHSPQDRIVGIENAGEIYTAATHPKSFISLDGTDHLLSNKEDSIYAGEMIASWASKYIQKPEKEELSPIRKVMVRIGTDRFTTEVKVGKHSLLADEPTSVGGKDLGPTPYDLLMAAVGTCTAITLRMYADRKQWPVESIDVHLDHMKIHTTDCKDCDNASARIDHIEKSIEIKGDLDEKQINRLLQIADKCPVHRTLLGEVKITTEIIS